MIITCPDCSTHYTVDAKTLGQSGHKVRCVTCGHEWFARPEDAREPSTVPAPESTDTQEVQETQAEEPAPQENIIEETENPPAPMETEPQPEQQNTSIPMDEAPKSKPAHRAYRDKLEAKARQKRRLLALGAWGGVFVMLFVLASVAVLNRQSIVRAIPKTAGAFASIGFPVDIRGFAFKDLKTQMVRENGDVVIHVTGSLFNGGKKSRPAPLVRISLRDETETELFAWTVPVDVKEIPAKSLAHFSTTISNPVKAAVDFNFDLTDIPLNAQGKVQEKELAHEGGH